MADVFISYIHEEESVAEALQQFLQKPLDNSQWQPLPADQVFLSSDTWQVLAGEIWLDRIMQELKSAKVVILLLSKESISRPWVNFEAGAALALGKKIIPVCFGNISKGNMDKPYSGIQGLDLPDGAYYLVHSICHWLEKLSPPPWFSGNEPESLRQLIRVIQKYDPSPK